MCLSPKPFCFSLVSNSSDTFFLELDASISNFTNLAILSTKNPWNSVISHTLSILFCVAPLFFRYIHIASNLLSFGLLRLVSNFFLLQFKSSGYPSPCPIDLQAFIRDSSKVLPIDIVSPVDFI